MLGGMLAKLEVSLNPRRVLSCVFGRVPPTASLLDVVLGTGMGQEEAGEE